MSPAKQVAGLVQNGTVIIARMTGSKDWWMAPACRKQPGTCAKMDGQHVTLGHSNNGACR